MVQIRLDDSFRTRSELERRIGERYKVRVTLVNVRADATPIARMSQVSRTAASLLDSLIDDGTRLGVAWGSTMTEVSRHLPRRPLTGVKVVQLNGAGNAHHSGIPYLGSLLGQLANAYEAQTVHFPVPAFFDYAETKEAMWRERSVQASLRVQQSVDRGHLWRGRASAARFLRTCTRAGILTRRSSTACASWESWGDMCTVLLREDGSWADLELNRARIAGRLPRSWRVSRDVFAWLRGCTARGRSAGLCAPARLRIWRRTMRSPRF